MEGFLSSLTRRCWKTLRNYKTLGCDAADPERFVGGAAGLSLDISHNQAGHPGGEGSLVICSGGVGGFDVDALLGVAILADFEFAFDAADGDAEALDSGEHGAAEAVGHGAPLFGEGGLIGLDESGEERIFASFIFDELEGSAGMDGDVVPGGHGERIGVVGGRDVAVGAGEDDEDFAVGEGLPVAIGFGEMAFDEAVFAFVFDDQREVGGDERFALGTEEDGEGIGLHGFDEEGTVGDLVEFWGVHEAPESSGQWLVVSGLGGAWNSNDPFDDHRIRCYALASGGNWATGAAERYTQPPNTMWRAIVFFMLGIFGTALVVSLFSVYVFHDVDKEMIGRWNEAFAGLCVEFVFFTAIIGGGVALLTFPGRHLLRLQGYSPRVKLCLFLGVGVTVLQYPWEFAGRIALPEFEDSFLSSYLIVAIVFCSVVIVRDNFKQKRIALASAIQIVS